MPAVGVPAPAQQRPHLREALGQITGLDPPKTYLAEPGRIHEEPAPGERHHDRRHRGMAAPADSRAYLPRAEPEAGLDGVEEARLSGARRSGDDRGSADQGGPKGGDAFARHRAGAEDLVPGRAEPLAERETGVEVDLVDD